MIATKDHEQSRRLLLEAGGVTFAQVGYGRATIRQIVEQAGTSLGAVNYHFGDKAGLYQQVLAYAHRHTIEQYKQANAASEPEQRLRLYVRTLLSHVLGEGPASWPGLLLCNELGELISRDAKNKRQLLRRYIHPRLKILLGIVGDLLGPSAGEEAVVRHAISVISQCIYYLRSRPVAEAAFGRALTEADLDPLTSHVTAVSLAGIEVEANGHPLTDRPPTNTGRRTPKQKKGPR